jgi:hypothetical protein
MLITLAAMASSFNFSCAFTSKETSEPVPTKINAGSFSESDKI